MSNARANGKWQGMNWIRQEKRLAIYLRDGLACVYCSHSLEQGATLSLDHLKPHSKGGKNGSTNLVTCCKRCNSSRGTRSVRSFCVAVSEYIDNVTSAADIERHVRNCAKRVILLAEAKEMLAARTE